MWGDIGFPGEDDVDTEVPWIIGGTLDNCLLDELDDLCKIKDDDIESDSTVFESLIRWYFVKAAVVLRMDASRDAESLRKLLRSFFCSRSRMKSLRLSSSVWGTDPEEACPFAEELAPMLPGRGGSGMAGGGDGKDTTEADFRR